VEFRPGASVLAAADGTVLNATPEPSGTGRFTVRVNHSVDGRVAYATDYTNLTALAPGVFQGATVTRGQVLGPAGVQSQMIGTTSVTWAMTHFQMNDFSKNEGLTNPNAVSPESFLSAEGRTLFDSIWRATAYQSEWCEPFPTNSRLATFPVARRAHVDPERWNAGAHSRGALSL
jgi:murein DD-endopeptidase MepM/ murein hydrolase activator NlpD